MQDSYLDEIQSAFQRVEYDLRLLRDRGEQWKYDPDDKMFEFQGLVDPFLMRKYSYDLLREIWHVGDGIEHWINHRWKEGTLKADSQFSLDGGKGPGRAVVRAHVRSAKDLQLCADLANLSKHYRLTRVTQTGEDPPVYGDTIYRFEGSGKLDYSDDPESGQRIRTEKPKSVKVTMLVLNAKGEELSDVVTVAESARDSWFDLLSKLGVEFERAS